MTVELETIDDRPALVGYFDKDLKAVNKPLAVIKKISYLDNNQSEFQYIGPEEHLPQPDIEKAFNPLQPRDKYGKWVVYHGTEREFDPKEIRPGSHFGTLGQANSLLMGQQSPFYYNPDEQRIHEYYYKPEGEVVHINQDLFVDEHADEARAIARHLHKTGHFSKEERDQVVNNHLYAERTKALHSLLKAKGISTIRYKNRVEDKASKYKHNNSLIIFDTHNLKYTRTLPPSTTYIDRRIAADVQARNRKK